MNATVEPHTLYLSVDQVAKRYGVSKASIWRWRRQGKFPKGFGIGPNCTRWRLDDLLEHESTFQASFMTDASFLLAS